MFIQRFDHEWVDVTVERSVQCCDCGLVHDEEYRIIPTERDGDHIIRKAVRNPRATANRRRSLKARKEGIYDGRISEKGNKNRNSKRATHKKKLTTKKKA